MSGKKQNKKKKGNKKNTKKIEQSMTDVVGTPTGNDIEGESKDPDMILKNINNNDDIKKGGSMQDMLQKILQVCMETNKIAKENQERINQLQTSMNNSSVKVMNNGSKQNNIKGLNDDGKDEYKDEVKQEYKDIDGPINNEPFSRANGNEIITLCIGESGCNIGKSFINTIMVEHKLNVKNGKYTGKLNESTYLNKIDVYFRENDNGIYQPRSLFIDLNNDHVNKIRKSNLGNVVDNENFIGGGISAGYNWAKGHYTEGAELIDHVMEQIREELEICDSPQGFHLIHSIYGGCGSGLGSMILLKIRSDYPKQMSHLIGLFPSKYKMTKVNEANSAYNSVLTMHNVISNANFVNVFDNESLIRICGEQMDIKPKKLNGYKELNDVLGLTLGGITSSLRFDHRPIHNNTLQSMNTLLLFPRLKFFVSSQSPYFIKNKKYQNMNLSVNGVLGNLHEAKNFTSNIKFDYEGKYLSYQVLCRCANDSIFESILDKNIGKSYAFADDFIFESQVQTSMILDDLNVYKPYTSLMTTSIVQTTAIKKRFKIMSANFARHYKRSAGLHEYTGEGMDRMEFEEADRNLRDLIDEYAEKEKISRYDDDDDD